MTGLLRGSSMGLEVWGLSPGEAEWYLAGVFMHRGAELPIKTEHDEEYEEGLREERAKSAGETAEVPITEHPEFDRPRNDWGVVAAHMVDDDNGNPVFVPENREGWRKEWDGKSMRDFWDGEKFVEDGPVQLRG